MVVQRERERRSAAVRRRTATAPARRPLDRAHVARRRRDHHAERGDHQHDEPGVPRHAGCRTPHMQPRCRRAPSPAYMIRRVDRHPDSPGPLREHAQAAREVAQEAAIFGAQPRRRARARATPRRARPAPGCARRRAARRAAAGSRPSAASRGVRTRLGERVHEQRRRAKQQQHAEHVHHALDHDGGERRGREIFSLRPAPTARTNSPSRAGSRLLAVKPIIVAANRLATGIGLIACSRIQPQRTARTQNATSVSSADGARTTASSRAPRAPATSRGSSERSDSQSRNADSDGARATSWQAGSRLAFSVPPPPSVALRAASSRRRRQRRSPAPGAALPASAASA